MPPRSVFVLFAANLAACDFCITSRAACNLLSLPFAPVGLSSLAAVLLASLFSIRPCQAAYPPKVTLEPLGGEGCGEAGGAAARRSIPITKTLKHFGLVLLCFPTSGKVLAYVKCQATSGNGSKLTLPVPCFNVTWRRVFWFLALLEV